ncbi:MAG: hypothetical protein FJ146_09065 [Deltaproteobacteria bacterium]|nr:hypothetical protein [Deltaproteobacteria bacterium]
MRSRSNSVLSELQKMMVLTIALAFLGCRAKHDGATSDLTSSWLLSGLQLPVEPYPFNSLPLSRLEEDAAGPLHGQPLPPVVPVKHLKQLPEHGIRYLQTNRAIAEYVRPGDIFVEFQTMGAEDPDPMMLIQKGMYHAGIVIANQSGERSLFFPNAEGDAFLCHIDTTGGYDPSGCGFVSPTHFFRVTDADPAQVQDAAMRLFRNWRYDYMFKLAVDSQSDIDDFKKSLNGSDKTPLYCSELPFMVHAVASGRFPVKPVPIAQILAEFNDFRAANQSLYRADLNDDVVTKSIVRYFSSFLPSGVDSLVDNPVARRYVKSALNKRPEPSDDAKGIAGRRLVPPWIFMDASKSGASPVRYIGTYYPVEYKTVAIPVDSMKRIASIKGLIDSTQRSISAASSHLALANFSEQVKLPQTGHHPKNVRFVQWVRRKPEERNAVTDFKSMNIARKATAAYLVEQLNKVEKEQNLEYQAFIDICDTFLYSNDALTNARNTLVQGMKKLKNDPESITSIETNGSADDMRLRQQWEDFGCPMASRSAFETLTQGT